jgi:hypothetical protein
MYQMPTVEYHKAISRGYIECRSDGNALQVINNEWLVQWINTHPSTRMK